VCASGNAFDIPVYISPIAVVFNLNGISGKGKTLNMDAETIAKIFDGKITKWNDDAIKQQNPKVDLPDLDITVVHRSDKSGTTKNFLSYVKDAAGDAWSYELGENWPNEVGQGAKGTSGVISTVQQADGTIGYADASQAGELGTVAVKVGDDYVPFSAEAAAKVVDASPLDESATGDNRVVVKLDHNTTEKGAYPIVLVSYDVACPAYKDANTAKFVKSWLTYVVSDEGQQTAASAAGSAPLSDTMPYALYALFEAPGTGTFTVTCPAGTSNVVIGPPLNLSRMPLIMLMLLIAGVSGLVGLVVTILATARLLRYRSLERTYQY